MTHHKKEAPTGLQSGRSSDQNPGKEPIVIDSATVTPRTDRPLAPFRGDRTPAAVLEGVTA
jgi:hypothetical protein